MSLDTKGGILYDRMRPLGEATEDAAGRVVDRNARDPLEAGLFRSALGLPA